ncbi:MAG: SIS domain-containing protein [Acidobacteria bacterium]|nr:SIS domain-containing protein [Acidobacteriota bacterium]
MRDAIEEFRDDYAGRYAAGVRAFLGRHGRELCRELQGAPARARSTVYIFGNGGSHAIGKCIEFALQRHAAARGAVLRVRTGVDVHLVNCLGAGGDPGISFAGVLEAEGADARDLLVLISGSGDSDNLCEAASYATRHSLPTVALVGSGRGRLSGVVPPGRCFSAPFEDQQISEDIIQSLAHLLERPAPEGRRGDWAASVAAHAEGLARALRAIPADFISAAAAAAVKAFRRGRFVLVSGFDDPALSACAEHTAHNLYWDSVYQVESPPRRLIRSSPTACDFSGISNDRHGRYLSHLTGAGDVGGDGVALFYSMSLDSPALLEVVGRLHAEGVPALVVAAGEGRAREYANVKACTTGLREPQAQAGVAQVFGHILGRLIRLMLLGRGEGSDSAAARFLIEHDLAQRRLLNE